MMEKTKFKEALDIWAQFFIAPLMKRNTVEREINAVDSEFDLALLLGSKKFLRNF